MQHSARYVITFAAAICAFCSIFVASSAVLLKDRQEANRALDIQKKVLIVADLMDEKESLPAEEIRRRFEKNITPKIIDVATGSPVDGVDPATFDQRDAAADPKTSRPAPPNAAKVVRIPNHAQIFEVIEDGALSAVILPIEGKGLWSTLYGYLALAPDVRTINGITFYEHGETAGLGGEVDNPRWKALWKGRQAFDDQWQPAISLVKGSAGPPDQDPHHVDGLSGATITSRGVTNLLAFWLGDDGFAPYLEQLRNQKGT
ncbi:MAG: Na(+)-translocating NADH-quinone reductase subunit C [Deltaproteobacteria bacterium]|nr:Na(+)-translocating NADH-quinone reductase subunit C [Deltaproteobacteria bacterium]